MKRDRLRRWLGAVLLAAGLGLLLYPTLSNAWIAQKGSWGSAEYQEEVDALEPDETAGLWAAAEAYNDCLARRPERFFPTQQEHREYEGLLDPTGHGVMCRLEVPAIRLSLPVYHGVEEGVLQVAAGHLEGSSLPVGGPGTHCVISGHSGLPSARLLSDLERLKIGDEVSLYTLGRRLEYRVREILVVEPGEWEALDLEEGEDLCTLLTCTPYGVNSHRLLVRGVRTVHGRAAPALEG